MARKLYRKITIETLVQLDDISDAHELGAQMAEALIAAYPGSELVVDAEDVQVVDGSE